MQPNNATNQRTRRTDGRKDGRTNRQTISQSKEFYPLGRQTFQQLREGATPCRAEGGGGRGEGGGGWAEGMAWHGMAYTYLKYVVYKSHGNQTTHKAASQPARQPASSPNNQLQQLDHPQSQLQARAAQQSPC